jgi:hypothetical protein
MTESTNTNELVEHIKQEYAVMEEDRSITIKTSSTTSHGMRGHGSFNVKTDDEDYEETRQRFGLESPGDSHFIEKKHVGPAEEFEPNLDEADEIDID